MSSNFVKPGIGSVGQYQMSGVPYVRTATIGSDNTSNHGLEVSLPTVSRKICIKDNSSTGSAHDDIIIHFVSDARKVRPTDAGGDGTREGEYFVLKPGEMIELDIRARRFYISHRAPSNGHTTEVSVCAVLTNIEDDISYE